MEEAFLKDLKKDRKMLGKKDDWFNDIYYARKAVTGYLSSLLSDIKKGV